MRLIDSHCHVDTRDYDADREAVLQRAWDAGVEHLVVVGLWREEEGGVASARKALTLAHRHPNRVSAAIGIHPHDVARASPAEFEEIEQLCGDPRVVAVGETGLDYHYDHSPRDQQQAAFARFLRLAHAVDKPVVIHTREADDDTLRIIDAVGLPAAGGIIHCFTGTREAARAYLERGFHLSFSGISTFKTAEEIRAAAALAPLDRILIETDSPYLAPPPYRGKRNEPAWVAKVAETLAQVHGIPVDVMADTSTRNARRLLRLPS